MAKNLVLNRTRKVPAEDTAAFGAIAERFRRAGALERAVELCREGLQKFPDHISARVTLGWSLLDLGKYDEARVELEQVLRRAPDNLAAIRGLAELHDRFEHTLHLPMDGPGQWPPPPESMDDAGTEGDASAAGHDADHDLEMTPAALGIPIWSPAVSPTPEVETPPARAASVAPPPPAAAVAVTAVPPAAPAVAVTPAPAPVPAPAMAAASAPRPVVAAVSTPVSAPAEAPAPPVATAPVAAASVAAAPIKAEASASGSGMSSVREIDFAASAPAPAMQSSSAAVEPGVARTEATEFASDAYAVSDADIQALIAEAESLDAAAGATPAELETVSLDAMALDTEDPLAAVAQVEPVAPAVSYSSVTEPISVDFDLDTPPGGMAIPLTAQGVVSAEAAAHASSLEMSEAGAGFAAALESQAPVVECSVDVPVEAAAAVTEPALDADELFEAALEVAAPIVEAALTIEEPAAAALAKEEPAEAALARQEPAEAALAVIEEPAEAALAVREEEPAEATRAEPVVAARAEPEVAPQPEIEIAAAVDVAPAVELAPHIDVVSEIEVAPAIEALVAAEVVELAPVAAVADVVSIEAGRTAARSPVPALERFLTKVQARKAQLMTESVA